MNSTWMDCAIAGIVSFATSFVISWWRCEREAEKHREDKKRRAKEAGDAI